MVLLRALIWPLSPIDPLFINPLVSIVPRMFIGVVAYYVYTLITKLLKLLTKKDKNTAIVAASSATAGAFGMITNTALVMTALYVFYAQKIADLLGVGFKALLIGIISSSAIIEAVSGDVLTAAIITVYYRVNKRKA